MLDHLDGTDLLNAVRLLLTGGDAKAVVVEGEDDYDLLEELFRGTSATLVPGYGKPKTLEAAHLASDEGLDEIRFLVDADFDRLTGKVAAYPANVTATQHYDLAVDIVAVAPETIERIARFASGREPGKIQSLTHFEQVNLTLGHAATMGAFRLASEQSGWGLNFENFPHQMVIPNESGASIDLAATAKLLVSRTKICQQNPLDVTAAAERCRANTADDFALVHGHDLLTILLVVGRRFGAAKSSTGYETQFKLTAAAEVERVPAIASLASWARAA